jgi:metal-responsive CopG/Arc/MetJ family transcriptional regulator
MQNNSARVVFGLPDSLLEKVDAISRQSGLSRSRVVVRLLELGLCQPAQVRQQALLNQFQPEEKEFSDA